MHPPKSPQKEPKSLGAKFVIFLGSEKLAVYLTIIAVVVVFASAIFVRLLELGDRPPRRLQPPVSEPSSSLAGAGTQNGNTEVTKPNPHNNNRDSLATIDQQITDSGDESSKLSSTSSCQAGLCAEQTILSALQSTFPHKRHKWEEWNSLLLSQDVEIVHDLRALSNQQYLRLLKKLDISVVLQDGLDHIRQRNQPLVSSRCSEDNVCSTD